jgi:hypothetical protein
VEEHAMAWGRNGLYFAMERRRVPKLLLRGVPSDSGSGNANAANGDISGEGGSCVMDATPAFDCSLVEKAVEDVMIKLTLLL